MTKEKRLVTHKNLKHLEEQVLFSKSDSYSSEDDVLSNFKTNGEALGLSPFQIWAVYFNKHVDSINNAIKNNPNKPIDPSETLRSRIIDARNYLSILDSMLIEHNIGKLTNQKQK